jgi:hypothetical protein
MKIIINLGREILLLGSVRESIVTPSETSSEKMYLFDYRYHPIEKKNRHNCHSSVGNANLNIGI